MRLLAAARGGDQRAFDALYRQHIRSVRGFARSLLRTRDVDDVCQDVFLRAFLALPKFAGACSFRTWLRRITLFECLRTTRRHKQARNGGCHLVSLDASMAVPDPVLEKLPARLDMERLLAQLRPSERRMLEMAYAEEMPATEMALVLGTTVPQVKSALYRAKLQARKQGY